MLGPLGGNKVWTDDKIEAAREEAQNIANEQNRPADEGGVWYGYKASQGYKYVMEDFEFIDTDTINSYKADQTITELYVAYKQ